MLRIVVLLLLQPALQFKIRTLSVSAEYSLSTVCFLIFDLFPIS